MGLATFKGGIHPYEGKELSENKPIQVLLPKGELVFPMSQHIGAPCKPLVQKGDYVKVGQLIGDTDAFVSAPIHASVSGTVTGLEEQRSAMGGTDTLVVIETDKKQEVYEGIAVPEANDLPEFIQ